MPNFWTPATGECFATVVQDAYLRIFHSSLRILIAIEGRRSKFSIPLVRNRNTFHILVISLA
jgi:hypothetical protein